MPAKLKIHCYKLWAWLDDITPGDHLAAELVWMVILTAVAIVGLGIYALVRYAIGA